MLVCDNTAIHKTQRVAEFLSLHNVGMITIKPYFTWLNPIEGYISLIKKKIRTKLEMNKLLTKTMIRKWVSEASAGDSEKFVRGSRKES